MSLGRVSFRTLGCRVNSFETVALSDAAAARGLEIVGWGAGADLAVVNSCALTSLAEAKTRREIRVFARKNPKSPIAVVGCMAQTSPEALKSLPNVAWIVGNSDKMRLFDIIFPDGISRIPRGVPKSGPAVFSGKLPRGAENAPLLSSCGAILDDRMNLKIQDGCNNACSYCIIPRARGGPRSRDFDSVLSDARAMVLRGAREIVLTGINILKYSSARGGLADLLDEFNAFPEILRLRIGSMEPADFDFDSLFERMADPSHKLMPHLHLSVQSLSDKVLRAMRRKYCAAEFLEMVSRARERCPGVSVGADIICGHPHEGAAEFEETKGRLVSSGLTYAHIFTFSPRPGTASAVMGGAVPVDERKRRADELRLVARSMRDNFVKSQIGACLTILLENRLSNGDYLGYTGNYVQTAVAMDKGEFRKRIVRARPVSIDDSGRLRARFEDFADL